MLWQYGGKTWYVAVWSNGPGLQVYDAGEYTDNFQSTGTPDGTFTEGPNGTITWTVARNLVGSPGDGAVLTSPYADDHGTFALLGTGLRLVAPSDRAPDVAGGSNYTVKLGTCVPA